MADRWIFRLLFCGALQVLLCHAADTAEIVRRATVAMRSDWAAVPNYAFIQRDETVKNGKQSSRTNQVVMMAGSDYYMPVAIDDRPLSPERQKLELQKLNNEFQRRNHENPAARRKRTETYLKQRAQNGALLLDFPESFSFTLAGEETVNGYQAYVLDATPRKKTEMKQSGTKPNGATGVTAKILAGMRGRLWVEKTNFHWIRAESTVMTPVSIFGIFARVLPGTHIELEMMPVTDTVWLVSRFTVSATISRFWMQSTQETRTTYSDYRLNGPVLAALLAKGGS